LTKEELLKKIKENPQDYWLGPSAYTDNLQLLEDLPPKINYLGPGKWLDFIKKEN